MGAKILVVDDNAANLQLMAYVLRAYGHAVTAVSNAADALAAHGYPFDLVLTDIRMPDMDGYELSAKIRETFEPLPPIVAVTALAMVGDRERVLAAGFDGYISKPIDPERFVDQVQAFVPAELRLGSPCRPS